MKVGFLGAGKMAEAMIASLITTKTLDPHKILACDVDEARRQQIKRLFGINVYSRALAVVEGVDVLFLAVKPQQMDAALEPIAALLTPKHLLVSIVAGRTLASIEALVPEARVVRVMPNLPCVVGDGMSAFCMGSRATRADRTTVMQLLGCSGRVIELPEEQFDAVTALSGSGPAFLAHLLDGMVSAAEKMGIAREAAVVMAEQTMLGTARLLLDKDTDLADLVEAVSSRGGTTVAGMSVLRASDVGDVLHDTLQAAARRSRELSG